MKQGKISNRVIRRLPKYLRQLQELADNDVDHISSGELGSKMGLTASQIRQDFSCFGEFGQQGYGYSVEKLLTEISAILGVELDYPTVLVGVGNLGRALAINFDFASIGYRLMAAFDVDPDLIGTTLSGIPILSMDDIEDYVRENHVIAAVLAVPRTVTHEVTLHLQNCGIRAICNFTNTDLGLQNTDILVENVLFSDSFLTLGYYLAEELRAESSDIQEDTL